MSEPLLQLIYGELQTLNAEQQSMKVGLQLVSAEQQYIKQAVLETIETVKELSHVVSETNETIRKLFRTVSENHETLLEIKSTMQRVELIQERQHRIIELLSTRPIEHEATLKRIK